MGVPDDANPLNRRLPAEVVSRRRKVEKVEKEEAPLPTDRGQVLALKPEQRFKWLSKALQKCQEGRLPNTTIFDIVTHAKFASETPGKIGQKMYRAVRANLELFSAKQQRFLEDGECRLVQLFRRPTRSSEAAPAASSGVLAEQSHAGVEDAAVGDGGAEAGEAAPEGTGILDSNAIAMLWGRLLQLTAEEREEAVEKLDARTKECLEDFLEARIQRAQATSGGQGGQDAPDADASGGAGAAPAPPRGSRSRSGSPGKGSRSSGSCRRSRSRSHSGSRGRESRRRSRSGRRSHSRDAEKARKAKDKAEVKKSKEAKGKRAKEHDGGSRRGRKGKTGRGRSSSGAPSRRGGASSSGSSEDSSPRGNAAERRSRSRGRRRHGGSR